MESKEYIKELYDEYINLLENYKLIINSPNKIAFPFVYTKDMWIIKESNIRYFIYLLTEKQINSIKVETLELYNLYRK